MKSEVLGKEIYFAHSYEVPCLLNSYFLGHILMAATCAPGSEL